MPEATFVFWDVQHGSAAYIRTPNGKHIVIDLGVGSIKHQNATFSPLLHLKRNWGVAQLDYLIITHPHRDHLDDIINLDQVPPRALYRPVHLTELDILGGNQLRDRGVINEYFRWHLDYSAPLLPGTEVNESSHMGGLELQLFTSTACPTSNLNNHSIVVVATYAGSKIIIPGDNESPSWRELLQRPDFRHAIAGTNILVAPHHGRQAGFSPELFEYITPRLVIVSDGVVSGTSATALYRQEIDPSGWPVNKRSGGTPTRRVLTTRADGVVSVKMSIRDRMNYLDVTVD